MIPRFETPAASYRQHFEARQAQKLAERETRRLLALEKLHTVLPTVAAQFSSVQRLYLFGSVTRPGQFHAKSDVDVGVVGTTAEDYFALWRELEAALPAYLVDLCDIFDSSFFANTIQKTGMLVYEQAS